MKSRRIAIAAVALAALGAACGGGTTPTLDETPAPAEKPTFEDGTFMKAVQDRGSLKVGVKFDVPQFGFLNPDTSKPEGFDVDLGAEIAKAIGVDAEYSEAISANRIPFLKEDKVDIVLSTMTINEERKKEIDFSDVYYVAGQSFLAKKGKPVTLDDADGKKVCTAKGSTSEKNLRALAPKAEVVLQDGYAQCFQLLQNDQADAVTTDDVILVQFLKQDPDNYELSGGTFSLEPYGAGIKQGRPEFVEFVNDIISDMKSDGRWAALYDKWIGSITGGEATPPPADVEAKVGP